MLMDGRTLAGISMKWPPMEIVNYLIEFSFVGRAEGKRNWILGMYHRVEKPTNGCKIIVA
jgi:hypothetical protein